MTLGNSGTKRSWWRLVRIVFAKELMDHTRDKRSIVLSLIFPLMAPILIGILLFAVVKSNVGGEGVRFIEVPVVGAAYAPGMIDFLDGKGVAIRPIDGERAELSRQVATKTYSFVLVIPENAAGNWKFGVDVITDRTNPRSLADTAELMRYLTEYSLTEAARLVIAAGLDAEVVVPLTVNAINVGRAPNQAYLFYNMIPSLVMFMIFMGAVYLSIDTSVGERERGSLEPLLSAPVARWELLLGKSIAAFLFTAMVVIVNLTAFGVSINLAVDGAAGMAPPPTALVYATMFLVAVPMMAFAVAVQMTIAAMTRSAKEAQIYLGLLPVLPLIPGLALVFNPSQPGLASSLVPVFGQLRIFMELTSGNELPVMLAFAASASTLLFATLIFMLAARLFERERMVFGS